ncbi:hypothetical protein [Paenibacillus sp. MMS18-CY102]|uniref:hypothetical protein n=1 Tax=Paenibacillus sp. MMS18-CY102 TaxID=2682849 RepID=UPI0013656829|nr:hypothetical protein [Paenibacillus sp. MMS18-CY102]MWC30740.1 hypothetical protein [Paenibacillus sp. MMS18-CY102]
MITVKRSLHWSAVVGVACSFWLLLWLFGIVTTLYDLKQLDDADKSGSNNFMAIVGMLALWAGYRAMKRLALLRYGEFRKVVVVKQTEESYDMTSGLTGKVSLYRYSFMLNDRRYSKFLMYAVGLKNRNGVEIVYNTRKPDNNSISGKLQARFDPSANQWRSSMWHVIPRLILLVVIVAAIFALLFMDTLPSFI